MCNNIIALIFAAMPTHIPHAASCSNWQFFFLSSAVAPQASCDARRPTECLRAIHNQSDSFTILFIFLFFLRFHCGTFPYRRRHTVFAICGTICWLWFWRSHLTKRRADCIVGNVWEIVCCTDVCINWSNCFN